MNKPVDFLVTVKFKCSNMIDSRTLKEDFEDNAFEAYMVISDYFQDSVKDFSTEETVINVEVLRDEE